MPLQEYRRKRDFTQSPEPTGDEPRKKKARTLFFCVQKHLASHLHYDFRLEWNGVLLSWAVPKGPSLDPTIKRLAMHVEDHPFDYGTFEGVIPSGYGAGIVMLWDTGTWKPLVEDVEKALAKGDLKFELDGYKLKGSWALVRTRGYGGDRGEGKSWLLIKHKDDWSGDLDIVAFAPLSVKSEQDFHEILAEDNPAVWTTNKPVSGGETGALLREIIEKAAALKAERAALPRRSDTTAAASTTTKKKTRTKTTAPKARNAAAPAARKRGR